MIRLMSFPKSKESFRGSSPSDSCHDDKSISCWPWRMPRPIIPAAVRTLQLKLRASTSVTSQSTSVGTRRSLFSLFGKRHSTPVVPISRAKDGGVTCIQELRVSKSVGAVTDQFAKLKVGAVEDRSRSTPRRRNIQHHGSDQDSIKCVFSLPGAVIDTGDELCHTGDGTLRTSSYSELDTNEAKSATSASASNEAKHSHVHDEMTFTGQADHAHEVDILVIKHSNDDLNPKTLEEHSQELIMVEEMASNSPEENDVDSQIGMTDIAIICEPECSLDNELKDNPGKPNMGNGASPCEDRETSDPSGTGGDGIPYDDEDNLEEEVKFFEKTSVEGDDYVNLDDLLDRCPKSEVISNLQSAVNLSKCATRQLERALKKWSRISRGPFTRKPGTSKTKADVIDDKTVGLRSETARYLDEMNKVFFNFYCVSEELDDVEERQGRLVESIKAEMHSPSPSSPRPVKLPKRKQDLADLYLDNRYEGRFENHKVKALLGNRIPLTIIEEE